jgi:HEAT repeat protein
MILLAFAGTGLLAGVLYLTGVLGWILRLLSGTIRRSIGAGFWLWKRWLSWAHCTVFLLLVFTLLGFGLWYGRDNPLGEFLAGTILVLMGVTTCLAYLFISLEQYDVSRGYKVLHNPLKGQELATNLVHYGHRVGVPLLLAAACGAVAGFTLINHSLFETIGQDWYSLGTNKAAPDFADFLAYTLINLFRVVDLLNVAEAYNVARVSYVHQAKWPASTLLVLFRSFFTLVLLQQIFTSVRQWRLLSETITDFWSPHLPIHQRACGALSQHGPAAARPLLDSLRSVPAMTAEQRAYLPRIIAAIGPATIPTLLRRLEDPCNQVRAVVVAALGLLHAHRAVPALIRLLGDPSDWVRQSLVETLGAVGQAARERHAASMTSRRRWFGRFFRRDRHLYNPQVTVAQTVEALRTAVGDAAPTVRLKAAEALGVIGTAATAGVPDLIGLLRDADEAVRCQAAETLGRIREPAADIRAALVEHLQDPNPLVRTAMASALGALKSQAVEAVPCLLPLLQDREDAVRRAAADSVARIGTLTDQVIPALTGGLTSRDNVVREQTAEVLGTIGLPAAEAAPALADALEDPNDRVRAKAAEALGKIGEAAADSVPKLVRALRDEDNWVSALAAEALGEMGEAAGGSVPALTRSLRHPNPSVRANAAEALGKIGQAARPAMGDLEQAAQDEDIEVRAHALFALGEIGPASGSTGRLLLAALEDPHPQVRAAAVEALSKRDELGEAGSGALLRVVADTNDAVKIQVTKALPRLAGATTPVIEALRQLLQDDNPEVQVAAALALGKLGPAAAPAGEALLQAAQTGAAAVRDQALRAIAIIQPPEAALAFRGGLKDSQEEIRKVASAGFIKAAEITEDIIPDLIAALRDPEIQVRANAARVLARLDSLPAEAIALLRECLADPNDALRLNAALALRAASPPAVAPSFQQLLADSNPRLRLIAAGFVLQNDPQEPQATEVVVATLADSSRRLRQAALELIESLGVKGAGFRKTLQQRVAVEIDPELSDRLAQLLASLQSLPAEGAGPESEAAEEASEAHTLSI